MKVIDLTHVIEEGMPVYPGTEPPTLESASTYERDGYKETRVSMFTHTGTHMDAPSHVFEGAPTLDAMPASQFAGKAAVVDCTDCGEGEEIPLSRILALGEVARKADFLLIRTGWDRCWGGERYFGRYPVLSREAVRWIAGEGKKGVGLDVIGLDPIDEAALPRHRILLATGRSVIIENLCRLDQLPVGLIDFFALPLKFCRADGAPVRAVAALP